MIDPPFISTETALELLGAVVSEYPDRVYERGPQEDCLYVRNGSPDCLGGQVLARAGVGIETLRLAEGNTIACNSTFGPDLLSLRARRILSTAQNYQDAGHPWIDALEAAENLARTFEAQDWLRE